MTWAKTTILGLALAGVACDHVQPVVSVAPTPVSPPVPIEPEPAPPSFEWQHRFELAPDAGRFAVLGPDARLWRSPDALEPLASKPGFSTSAVEVLATEGEFVEIALGWAPASHTLYCLEPLFPLGLRVWVREDELSDVVVEPALIDFGDGSGLNVAPGVLVDRSEAAWELTTWGDDDWDSVSVSVPASFGLTIGKIYAPARYLLTRVIGPAEDGDVRVGDARIRHDGCARRSPGWEERGM